MILLDPQGRIVWTSADEMRTASTGGMAKGRLLTETIGAEPSLLGTVDSVAAALRDGKPFRLELPSSTGSDSRSLAYDACPVGDASGAPTRFVVRRAARDNGAALEAALALTRQAVWHWQPADDAARLPETFLGLFGYEPAAARDIDGRLLAVAHPDDAAPLREWYHALAADGRAPDEIEYRIRGADGTWHWIISRGRATRTGDGGQVLEVSGTHADVTQRRQAEAEIRQLAYFDALTGLANRAMLQENLVQLIATADRAHERLAVLFIDLDNFKMVNDSFGHEAGDALLRGVAERLRQHVRAEDVIARLGGDEFVIVLTQLPQDDLPSRAARRLIEALSPPFVLHGQEVNVSPSIGISVFPDDGRDGPTLVKNADTAMYRVKEAGRNSYRFFTAAMNAAVVREARIETRLRHAMRQQSLEVHYQPQVDARTRRILGAEALLRWTDEELGPMAPLRFVPIAERTSLIGALGDWVLRTACRQARQWHDAGYTPLPVSVNISPAQFNDPDFVPRLRDILAEVGADPTMLTLELTEATLMKDAEQSVATLGNLKSMGLRLAVDGFGTGYSSLAYLRRFPIDKLKIDRSFILEIPDSREAVEIASAVIDIGNRLRLLVSAEGVETEAQAVFLQKLGCTELQGFHFEAAVTAERFAALLQAPR